MARGKGILYLAGREYALEAGSFAHVPAGEEHQFLNNGRETFALICIVPPEGDQ
ncbi:MAG: cupin domain-containing protein [Bacillota bacterium]